MARPSRTALIPLFISLLAVPVWAQKTIHVPGDAATIQAGINATSDGDTVLVAPGTYVEIIDFKGKAITVTSSGGPTNTTIDGGQKGIVVNFATNETRASVINGFTITDDAPPLPTKVTVRADGILVAGANPTITNNIITNNRGFGIEVYSGSGYISGNTITFSSTAGDPAGDFGCDYDDGDGIYIHGASNTIIDPPVIDHNTIEQNVGHCQGGGIGLFAAPPSTIISNNIIANNRSLGYGGGVYGNGSASLYQNLIYNNVSGLAGGGVYLSGSGSSQGNGATGPLNVFVTNNTIYGNTISLNALIVGAWVDGSQVALPGYVSQLGFFNNLIIANDSYSAIACWPTYQYLSGAPPVVVNSDVINIGGPAYGGWCTSPAGNGNISADPKFKNPVGGDFHLQTGSPAIDTGFNAAPGLLATDLDGNPRIRNATGKSVPVVDMGAYEATGAPESRSPAQTMLTAQPATVFYGQAVNLSTTVTNSSSSPIPQGTISFMDDWLVLQQLALNNSGVATMSTSSLGVGPHWLVASFGGNTTYQPSISTPAEVVVNGFSTSTTISFSANPGKFGQPETLAVTVTLGSGNPSGTGIPTGNVAFYTSLQPNLLTTVPLSANGVATYTTTSLPSGTTYIQAIYQPTGGFLGSSSQNLPLEIAAPPVATVAVLPNSGSIATIQPLSVTLTVSGTTGNPTPTGSVTLTSGSYSSASTTLNSGSVTINVPAGSLAAGNDTLTVKYSGDSVYSAATGTGSVVVTLPFAISGTPLSLPPGATSGNKSTITVTPYGGFTGSAVLTAAITSSPAGATDLPAFSFGTTGSVSITTAAAATATLPVTTVAPVGCPQVANVGSTAGWLFPWEIALACVLLLAKPTRSRWRQKLAMLFLLVGLTSCLAACGGGGGGTSCTPLSSGTTPGNYVITVTGTSGSVTANGSVSVIVQ
jgi:parallel beta-helix repeat protein